MAASEPIIKVGIISSRHIDIVFSSPYRHDNGTIINGPISITADNVDCRETVFTPVKQDGATFELKNVGIGIGFHWQRYESQRFSGQLIILKHDGVLTAINAIGLEEYLKSVISSEMSAQSAPELLKAHAVISRSWALSQLKSSQSEKTATVHDDRVETTTLRINWYDRRQHELFDVCADDHCQRYQGVTRITNPVATKAVQATRGQVLTADGAICDARFSKCCGGAFELFENCWGPEKHSYLSSGRDIDVSDTYPDLTIEANARKWILSSPPSWCNTTDIPALDRAMNLYDRETSDFYRWTVEYSDKQIADIIKRRSGIDFGDIVDLIPEARGTSGRIYRLKIVGTRHSMTIGKELEIRRTLSDSHLRSSAFVVERADIDSRGVPRRIILHGAGWGHGVGLCQIGAAMMAENGHNYIEILAHYYKNALVERLYQ